MNENAKKKARQREMIDGIKAKYDTKEELTSEKKEVLQGWIKGIEKREAVSPSNDKDKALVLKMYKKIEEREKKMGNPGR